MVFVGALFPSILGQTPIPDELVSPVSQKLSHVQKTMQVRTVFRCSSALPFYHLSFSVMRYTPTQHISYATGSRSLERICKLLSCIQNRSTRQIRTLQCISMDILAFVESFMLSVRVQAMLGCALGLRGSVGSLDLPLDVKKQVCDCIVLHSGLVVLLLQMNGCEISLGSFCWFDCFY